MQQAETPPDEVVTAAEAPTSPRRASIEPFRPRIGRFEVLQLVGSGGMGKVYAAYDPELDRKVAVKLVHRGLEGGSEGRARLLREAQALARVSHPNVVAIHDVGTHDGEVFMAMEFVTGVDLRRWLGERPRGWSEVLARFLQAGEGLQAVHAVGLVHRDVKPDNLLVGVDGRVRVADFGLVGATEGRGAISGDEDERLTVPGVLMGTPAYMSPEQHRREPLTAASDLYSFCLTLYEGLYGERPFPARSVGELSAAKQAGRVAPAPAGTRVPAWLREVVLRGLAPAVGARWPTMAALLAALRSDPVERRRRRVRFAGWVVLAATAGLVAVLAILAGVEAWRRAEVEALAEAHLEATTQRIAALAEGGDQAGAAAAVAAFVAAEEHRGTRALSRAWLAEAARLRRGGDLVAARRAYASAYSSATEPAAALAALHGLADMLHESWSIDHLEVVLAALERVSSGPASEVAPLRRRIEVAAAQRDLRGASALLATVGPLLPVERDAWGPVLRALGGATATGHAPARVVPLGEGRLALASETAVTIVAATPTLPALATIALPERLTAAPWVLASRRHGEVWLLGWRELGGERAELVFYELRDGAVHERVRWEDALPLSAALVDEDRGPCLYVGIGPFTRHLVEVRRSSGGWMRSAPHPGTDAAASDIAALAAADLDGDGREELVVAAGPWRAYDVRVLRRGDARAALEMVTREKLGHVAAVAPLRAADGRVLLAVAKTDQYASPTQFPGGQHFGAPAGIHLRTLADGALVPAGQLALHDAAGGPAWTVAWLAAGDIDGDGREDLLSQIQDPEDPLPNLVIDRQRDAGEFVRVRLRGVVPRALAQVDDDPQLELVVAVDGRLWVLGAGDEALPRLSAPRPATLAVPPHADPTLVETQRRAEELVAMGLGREAAAQLERGADLATDPPQRAAMLQRAGDLYAAAQAVDEAGRAYDHLARIDGVAGSWGAAHLYHEAGRVDEALAWVETLLARDDVPAALRGEAVALRRTLAPLARPAAVLAWRFDQPLAEAWRIADPVGVRRDALRGVLQIDAFADTGELATFPVEWAGGPLSLSVDLTSERLEWGGGVTVGLRPAEATGPALSLGVGIEGVGGRTSLAHRIQCVHPDRARPLPLVEVAATGASTPVRGRLRIDLHDGRLICSWTPQGGATQRSVHAVREVPAGGAYQLVIAPVRHGSAARPWATALVERIEVGHARAGEVEPDPLATATRLHAEGDVAGALAGYPGKRMAPLIHVWRSAALFERGEPRAAEAAAGLALEARDEAADEALAHLLRLRPAVYGPLLRERAPERFAAALLAMWRTAVVMSADEVTLRGLSGLLHEPEGSAGPTPHATATARLWLLTHRGRAWARRGEHARARRDLTAALAAGEELEPTPGEASDVELALVAAHVELAALAAAEGSLDEARAHASRALERAAAPELVADELWVRPDLARLRDVPAWGALLDR